MGFGYRPRLAALWLVVLTAVGSAIFSSATPTPSQQDRAGSFHPAVYTLDLLIPIGGLGQRTSWYWANNAVQWFAYGLMAAGWLLTTTAVAGVTRVLTRR